VKGGGDAQALQDTGGVAFGLPASQLGKLLLQLAGQHAVLVGHFLLGVKSVLLFAYLIQAGIAQNDGVHDGIGVVGVLVLL
jgi:hypothetical protein